MKIGILTYHNANNYGAVLQAYALKKKLREYNHDVQIMNYCNKHIERKYSKILRPTIRWRSLVRPKYWYSLLASCVKNIYKQPDWTKQHSNFSNFREKHILENSYRKLNFNDVRELKLDAYIVGSDQIWESSITHGLDPVYFLDFNTESKKIAYAPSMNDTIKVQEVEYIKRTLSRFDMLSTRESSLAKKLADICNTHVETVVDPTLLLNGSDYHELFAKSQEKEKYVFVYFVWEDNVLMEIARKIAERLGFKLIELHYYKLWKYRKHNQKADMGPAEFLTYINNAEFVLTNSFHGTVFSLLLEKQFYSVYYNDSRKDSLLDFLNLQSRHIYCNTDIDLNDIIDYANVNRLIDSIRKKSLDYVQATLT